ncbi:Hypothetical protein ACGLYG10_0984 [Actinomyces glycerinitolerans]|uniref:Uncharacterized protein n=1 Tax=Actinomyces glycerinitolerans TaxID=1892869 RepID=A0A1M4RXQ6_9ACTO|nr:Hypothetical protein ACGLYG10_0984 [Actinomyces glycerinitolerans]
MSKNGTNRARHVSNRKQNVEIMRMPHQAALASTAFLPNLDISASALGRAPQQALTNEPAAATAPQMCSFAPCYSCQRRRCGSTALM